MLTVRAEHRIFIEKEGVPVSPWHDIPLYAKWAPLARSGGLWTDFRPSEQKTLFNMIVEIPRWTNGKLEVRANCPCRDECQR